MKDLLKFIACGSVDDGKSTLIGHLLYNLKAIYKDQEKTLQIDSKKEESGEIDYSLLLDGLAAEREQKITIDVAYRYFNTEKRSFIVADAPGHDEYTRNMAVGASFAEMAIILVDITKGVVNQTKRHTRICKMMGINDFIFTVNKMDLVQYDEKIYQKIERELIEFTQSIGLKNVTIIPVSAKEGENLNCRSQKMNWYKGENLLDYLEKIEIVKENDKEEFCFPVQRVCRPNANFRGYQGQIESGTISIGEKVITLPSKERARIKHIYVTNKKEEKASCGMPVTIELDREIDISRGCVLVKNNSLYVNNMFSAQVLWMDNEKLEINKTYYIKIGTKMTTCIIKNINYKIDVNTGEKIDNVEIQKNDIVCCDILLHENAVYNRFERNKALGRFILIEPISNVTSACGTINYNLNENYINYQDIEITKEMRSKVKQQKPVTLWFTGLSGAGKSSLANGIEKYLNSIGKHTMLLDGDNIRLGLNKDLKFSPEDRHENIRRIAEVAKLMNDAGLIVITAFISPYESDRKMAREIIGQDYIEIFINTPIEVCQKRDKKGLYEKAKRGIIKEFTGITSSYEKPGNPEIIINNNQKIEESLQELIEQIERYM